MQRNYYVGFCTKYRYLFNVGRLNCQRSSGNEIGFGAGGLRSKFRTGQIGQSVVNGSQRCVARRRNDVELVAANSFHAST